MRLTPPEGVRDASLAHRLCPAPSRLSAPGCRADGRRARVQGPDRDRVHPRVVAAEGLRQRLEAVAGGQGEAGQLRRGLPRLLRTPPRPLPEPRPAEW